MFLRQLTIRNYKSLRNVTFAPTPLTAIVGPNAAGKTNFADAIHFLSEVYAQGLETAIARKGGYENIAYRKKKRSQTPIEFEVVIDTSNEEIFERGILVSPHLQGYRLRLTHRFSFFAKGSGIRAPFAVKEEDWSFSASRSEGNASFQELARICRTQDGKLIATRAKDNKLADYLQGLEMVADSFLSQYPAQLLIVTNNFFVPFVSYVAMLGANFRPHQLSAFFARQSGVPTPNPSLLPSGQNLPALVDWLQRNHPKRWDLVMHGMRDILPELNTISVGDSPTQTLGLFFSEEGRGRPWNVNEVSDGTIQALALLVAAVDPRTSLLVIDEVESSVHPWILRVIMKQMREVTKSKNVIVTSHSPVLVNLLNPEEIWIAYRKQGATNLKRLIDLDPSVKEGWEEGHFRLSEFLDSGVVGQAVPGGI